MRELQVWQPKNPVNRVGSGVGGVDDHGNPKRAQARIDQPCFAGVFRAEGQGSGVQGNSGVFGHAFGVVLRQQNRIKRVFLGEVQRFKAFVIEQRVLFHALAADV